VQTQNNCTIMSVFELTLDPGEHIIAEGGDVAWLTPRSTW
jgi:uncharacterized protein (AIM24 family)